MGHSYTESEIKDICLNKLKLPNDDIICIYQYGSRVYDNFHEYSDYDYIVITKNGYETLDQYSDKKININFFTDSKYQDKLDNHDVSALECFFLPEDKKLLETKKYKFILNVTKIRNNFSQKSSNSFVKAKKKMTIEKDYDLNIGRKSLFHSFRIIMFGIQICKHGKILDYTEANSLYREIFIIYNWSELFATFKKRYNALCSEFRKIAPK